jgi:hypothetical protein
LLILHFLDEAARGVTGLAGEARDSGHSTPAIAKTPTLRPPSRARRQGRRRARIPRFRPPVPGDAGTTGDGSDRATGRGPAFRWRRHPRSGQSSSMRRISRRRPVRWALR